ncbi:MAG: RDD family protein [Granulosicoccaceae bacterium]|jgi:uncharacterized RDD family membrane protein YckC
MDDQLTVHSADAMLIDLPIAGIGSRSYAFIIDWHVRFILAAGWFLLIMLLAQAATGEEGAVFVNDAWRNLAIWPAAIVYFFYHPILELLMKGRTPGKRMAGVRIVTTDGSIPSAGAILMRNLFRLIDSLPQFYLVGLVTCAMTTKQLRLGDMAAGTLLIQEKKASVKDLEQMLDLGSHARLNPEQLELVQELRRRWNSLTQLSRIQLAEQLLERIGEALPPPKASLHDRERELRERLEQVVEADAA